MRDLETARPDYEAMYNEVKQGLLKSIEKIEWLEGELQRKDKDLVFLEGFKNAIELIFGKSGCNG